MNIWLSRLLLVIAVGIIIYAILYMARITRESHTTDALAVDSIQKEKEE